MGLLSLFLQGAALGITAAVSPGTFQTYLITQTLIGGWRRAIPVVFGPLLSDPLIIFLTLVVLNQIPGNLLRFIGFAGGLFAYLLAWGLFQDWRKGPRMQPETVQATGSGLRNGFVMNLLSPGPYMFWILVNGPILIKAVRQSVILGIAFLIGFYALFIAGMLGIIALFHQARRLGNIFVHRVTLVAIAILVIFGSLLIWQAVT